MGTFNKRYLIRFRSNYQYFKYYLNDIDIAFGVLSFSGNILTTISIFFSSLSFAIWKQKKNYAPNSESSSKNGNALYKDQLIRSQNEEILFLREENKKKTLIMKTLLENLEL